jgi:hypothetical protein
VSVGAGPETLTELQTTKGFTDVQWDIALEGLDPHVLGVAKKRTSGVPEVEDGPSVIEGDIAGLTSQKRVQRKGFG